MWTPENRPKYDHSKRLLTAQHVERVVDAIERSVETVDRRVDNRLAQPVQTAGQELDLPEPLSARFPTLGLGPHHASKTMSANQVIPDGLSGCLLPKPRHDAAHRKLSKSWWQRQEEYVKKNDRAAVINFVVFARYVRKRILRRGRILDLRTGYG